MGDLNLSGMGGYMNRHEKRDKNIKQKTKGKALNLKNVKPIENISGKRQENNKKAWKGKSEQEKKSRSTSYSKGRGASLGKDKYGRKPIIENPHIVHAPYNFVPFWEKTIERPEESMTSQAVLDEKLISGEIVYELRAATDIFIDNGVPKKEKNDVREFYKNSKGQYAIPGSTIRGLIRSNVQILSLSFLGDDIGDYALMYRDVATGIEKDRYGKTLGSGSVTIPTENGKSTSLSILKNVKAGYLINEGGEYYIYQTCVDKISDNFGQMNYYVISERRILDEYVTAQNTGKESRFDYLVTDGKLQHLPIKQQTELDRIAEGILRQDRRHSRRIESKDGNFVKYYDVEENKNSDTIRYHYRGKANSKYLPFYAPVSYSLKGDRMVTAIGKPGKYDKEGYVLITGPMQEKKAVYIIPEIDKTKEYIKIQPEDVKAFQIDYNRREKTLVPTNSNQNNDGQSKDRVERYKNFFALPEAGEENKRPVFYFEVACGNTDETKRLHFGYTARLRLYYGHKIKDGISADHKKQGLDYSKALFGYSNGNTGRRSRISFSDAVVLNTVQPQRARDFVFYSPKPTDCFNYLEQNGDYPTTYNDDDLQLRGIKQYHLKEQALRECRVEGEKTVFCPLPAQTEFRGKVRFRNLTEEELGLLFWSLKLERNSLMNVGKAKAYGYGAVKLEIKSAREFRLDQAYDLTADLNLSPYQDLSVDKLIHAYKTAINKQLNKESIDDQPAVKALFAIKNQTKLLDDRETSYMTLEEFKEQKQKNVVLPRLSQLYELQ